MKAAKETVKPALLLAPHRLLENNILVQTLLIRKGDASLQYDVGDMGGSLGNLFPEWPREMLKLFREFGREALDEAKREIKQRHTKQKGGIQYDQFFRQAMLRHYHQLLEKAKPFTGVAKWYHTKQLNGNRHYSTAPCRFSTYRPRLQFEVKKDETGALQLLHQVELNGSVYPLTDFLRTHYLLESGNEYFLLSYRDYQTLEWLAAENPVQYAFRPEELASQVLARLEQDYTVNRNHLFGQQEVAVKPVNRVFFSELNNTFLMLTPQWLYDGFVIEGPWQEQVDIVQNGVAYAIRRDKTHEKEFLELLESLHPNFSKQINGYYYLSFADAQKKQWFLKAYHQLLTSNIELLGMDMLKHFRYSTHQVETLVKVTQEEETRVTLKMEIRFGKEKVELVSLQKMLLAGQRAVMLKDGSLGVLGEEWLRQYAPLVKHGKVQGDQLTVSKWMALGETEAGAAASPIPSMKKEWWQRWQQWQQSDDVVYTVPAQVQAQLRPYQQKGYEWMRLLAEAGAGGCLADDMGLGKTLQAICFLASRVEQFPQGRHIIVCPSSLIYNWQQELEKFAPGIRTLVYHGANRKSAQVDDPAVQVLITSYGTLRADSGTIQAFAYDTAIVDESHNIKNPSAQITQAVSALQVTVCVALSGTPVVNNTFDLYAQLNVVLPGMFGSREFFKREYADAIDRFGDEDKIRALRQLTAPFILRRTKEQVATELPEKTESVLWCEMGGLQRELYEQIRDQIKSSLFLDIKQQGLAKSKLAVIQGILKLRQVCNSPLLLPEDERTGADSVKTDVLMDELKQILPAHKALVFSQFSSMLDLLAEECKRQGIKYYHFDGQTPPAKRAEMVNAFQEEGNDTHLFLISLKAGNAGLTLTAADYVFLFDPWWNTAVQQQAIDRTHRIGQTRNVFAYKMICKDTIEEKIVRLQEKKKQLAEDLVGADEGFVKMLSEEDIAYLFG